VTLLNSGHPRKVVDMPWLETALMEQRERFIADQRRSYPISELCDRYGMSRKTGYKWLERFEEHGIVGLADRSHAPHECPHRISPDMATMLCAAGRAHPSRGQSNCSTGCDRGTARCATGRHPAPSVIFSRVKAWCASGAVDVPFSTPVPFRSIRAPQ
jgi:hypothetical protein